MNKEFEILIKTRSNVSDLLGKISFEETQIIPLTFNNNIYWNAAHLLATQQILINKFAGLPYTLDADFIDKYKKGTKPEGRVSLEEFNQVRSNLVKQAELVKSLYPEIAGKTFEPYLTSFGITLSTVEESIVYNNVHEAIHFGYMKALANIIRK